VKGVTQRYTEKTQRGIERGRERKWGEERAGALLAPLSPSV
jgi:hypothetical protein